MIRVAFVAVAVLGAGVLTGCQRQAASPAAPAAVPAPTAPAPVASVAPASTTASVSPPMTPGNADGVPRTVADLPAFVGANVETRTVNCQVFTALQAEASTGAEAARYRATSDAWGRQLRAENGGDADAAHQMFSSFAAPYVNHTSGDVPPVVIQAAADQCVAGAPSR